MEPTCNLIIDSTCDLPRDVWDKPGITMLPFTYFEGTTTYKDDLFASRTPKDFYDWMRGGAEPSTSQPTQGEYEDVFRAAVDTGVPTVFISFGHALSGAYDGACMALDRIKEEKGEDVELYVVDSMLPSSPLGLFVAEAIRLRDRGMSAKELVAWAQEARYYVNVMFMVDNLESLSRGGRIPAGVAGVGDMLDVKPLLSIDLEGALVFAGVARGRKKGMKRMVDFFERNHSVEGESRYVVTGNADCQRDADRFVSQISSVDESALIIAHDIGPTIGSHVGPGMISIAFWGPDRRSNLSISERIAKRVKSE
ncbi:MAG: DegV family protein [Eggerthellaceae bacterium]|nr:DegV family protein [Eggerthellaceae bacterium]